MPPKYATRKRKSPDSDVNGSTSSHEITRTRIISEVAPVANLIQPYPLAAFMRFKSVKEWFEDSSYEKSTDMDIPHNLCKIVALTMATFTNPSVLTSIVWSPLPGWNPIEVEQDGRVSVVQHCETGFKLDPRMVLFLYGRLSANLGVMTTLDNAVKMFLPTVAVDRVHVFAGNRQSTFNSLTEQKIQIIDNVSEIIKQKMNPLNASIGTRLAQSVVSLAGQEKTGELASLVDLLQQQYNDDGSFQVAMCDYLESLGAQDSVKAPLVSALLQFGTSGLTNTDKLTILNRVRHRLTRKSLTQLATNLSIHLPVSPEVMNRYTGKDQQANVPKKVVDLAKEDLVILGAQVATGDVVYRFLEAPAREVFCATASDMTLYHKKKSGQLAESVAGPLEHLKLSTVDGELVKQLCAIPEVTIAPDVPKVTRNPTVTDDF